MARSARFYSSERATPQDRIAREFADDPRSALIAAMMQQEDRPAYGGWGEGLARVGSSIAGALMQKKLNKEREGRESEAQNTIIRALMGDQIAPQGGETPMGGGVTSQPIERTPNTQADMARILAGNPDTAGMGFDMRLAEMDRERQMADEQRRAAMEQQQWQQRFTTQQEAQQAAQQRQFAQQRELRGIPQATAPVPGRDTPLPQDVLDQQLQIFRAQQEAKAAATGLKLTEAEKAIDRKVGTELAEFVTLGGFADLQKGLNQLRGAVKEIDEGGVSGAAVGLTPNFILNAFNPRAVDVQNQIAEVAQRNLRLVLGGQFAMKEGEQLIQRAFNPGIKEKYNSKRVNALISSIEQAAKAKKEAWDHLQKHGTMKGFEGKLWSMQDFEAAVEDADKEGDEGETSGGNDVDDLVNKYRSR